MKPIPWLTLGLLLAAGSAVLMFPNGPRRDGTRSRNTELESEPAAPAIHRGFASPAHGADGSGGTPGGEAETGVADRRTRASARRAGQETDRASPSHTAKKADRSPGKSRSRTLIMQNLAPDMEVVKGDIHGSRIAGPVLIEGRQGLSEMKSSTTGTGFNSRQEEGLVVIHFGEDEDGDYFGEYTIEAAEARTTVDGIRFSGPLNLKMQNQHGMWYEFRSDSDAAFVLVSRDGKRKVFARPEGTP